MRRSATPEGTQPISQRKRRATKWDIVPEGFEGLSTAQVKASGTFGVPGQMRFSLDGTTTMGGGIAAAAAAANATAQALNGGGGVGHSVGAIGAPAVPGGPHGSMNRQARRLYIGNVGYEATEALLCGFFNTRMRELNLVNRSLAEGGGPGDACIAAQINAEKGYAFVEFRSPEEATNAMAFDGIVFQNQGLKIRRPKDYVGPDVSAPANIHVPGVVSTNVPDSPNKIFVGGLPTYLNDEQVMELLKAFGELRAFNLVREQGNGPSKGFAFCEYVDPAITELACQGLNDMELGDRRLIVQRASQGSGRGNAGGLAAGSGATGANSLTLPPSFTGGEGQGEAGEPTRCMQMLNMVTPHELTDDQEYAEIVEDIRDECARFGAVVDVRIPRPQRESKASAASAWKRASDADAQAGKEQERDEAGNVKEREGVGRVYVRFEEVGQCETALKAIAGRQFGGRVVIAAYLAEDNWPADEDGGQNSEETDQMAKSEKAGAEEAS